MTNRIHKVTAEVGARPHRGVYRSGPTPSQGGQQAWRTQNGPTPADPLPAAVTMPPHNEMFFSILEWTVAP